MAKELSVKEYAEEHGIDQSTVSRMIKRGILKTFHDGTKTRILGKTADLGCKYTVVYPGEPAEHLISGCGHTIYVITEAVKTFKYCPWCSLKINKEGLNGKF